MTHSSADINLVGVDLGGTKLNVGLIRNNKIIAKKRSLIPQNASDPWEIINLIINSIEQVIDGNPVAGIGIGVPSIVDRKKGIVYEVHNIPSWQEVHLAQILEQRFKVPVFVDNDANCFTLGEHHFGIGKNYKNIVGVTLGTGLGAGIINRGKLIDDANGGSGEFGMIPYRDGVIEDYCSGKFFRKFYNTPGEEMMRKAQNNEPQAIEAFEQYGKNLAYALQIIMYAIDPQMIILGGSIVKSAKFFDKPMRQALKDNFNFKKVLENIQIAYSQTPDIAILGAAALFFDRLN